MVEFPHERLDVYRVSVEFLIAAEAIASMLPRGRAYLADQLRRAATSVVLNIGEGAGEFAPADKRRFYRMARRSGTESAAILDICRLLALAPDEKLDSGRALLKRAVEMLTALVLRLTEPGTGTGAGTFTGGSETG